MRRIAAGVVAIALLAAGCGGASQAVRQVPESAPPAPAASVQPAPQPTPPSSPPPPSPSPAPALPGNADELRILKLAELRTALEAYLNAEPTAPAKERLAALLDRWGVVGQQLEAVTTIPLAEADLDGDGTTELITVLHTRGDWKSVPTGAAFVISRRDGQYRVDQSPSPPEAYLDGVALVAANTDLTGDGRPDIVWVARDHGAHTTSLRVLVSTWKPGAVETAGDLFTTTAQLRLEGKDLLLTGGTVSSVGAGASQRASTGRYRFVSGALKLVDRRFEPSEFGYHRLLDGMNEEVFGRDAEARAFYRSVLEPGRAALPPEQLKPEWVGRFGPAVTELARFRLGLSLLRSGDKAGARQVLAGAAGPYAGLAQTLSEAADIDQGCRAAAAWALNDAAFLGELNAPFGYNSIRWTQYDLCARAVPGTN